MGNIEDMAQKSLHILSDDQRLETFKKAAIEHSRSFEKSRIIPLYEELYEEVLSTYQHEQVQNEG